MHQSDWVDTDFVQFGQILLVSNTVNLSSPKSLRLGLQVGVAPMELLVSHTYHGRSMISESETSTPAWCHQPSLTQLCVLMNMPWLCKAELRLGLAWGYSVLSVRLIMMMPKMVKLPRQESILSLTTVE